MFIYMVCNKFTCKKLKLAKILTFWVIIQKISISYCYNLITYMIRLRSFSIVQNRIKTWVVNHFYCFKRFLDFVSFKIFSDPVQLYHFQQDFNYKNIFHESDKS